MRASLLGGLFTSLLTLASCSTNSTKESLIPVVTLPSTFTPPQVWTNTNLLRTLDLSKPYLKTTHAIIVENSSKDPQSQYFHPIPSSDALRLSTIEAHDKKTSVQFTVESVSYNPEAETQYHRITFPQPVAAGQQLTIVINTILTHVLLPLPASITQNDPQHLSYKTTRLALSAYPTLKQKSKLKFPSGDIPEFTAFTDTSSKDPQKAANILTYGPYDFDAVGDAPILIRYDYTSPLIHARSLERDLEVSHWGGNLAMEERYSLTNSGASLRDSFSRVTWTSRSYYNAPTAAIKSLTYPLIPGAKNVYYTDEIGNVTTSRFRSNAREAHLELRPRFPVFGGWNYTFVVGWNHDLAGFLKATGRGDEYVLKVPFLQGPQEPVTYDRMDLRIILPEGATNVKYTAPIPVHENRYLHYTFMDTIGRTTLHLSAENLVDETARGKDLYVTYELNPLAALRKPLTVTAGVLAIFGVSWMLGRVDVRIGK